MERVAFLIEETNERLRCLLNPETLVLRRTAGVRPRQSATGQVTGTGLADDPLLYTGGGRTELDLDLLFDVTLPGSSVTSQDVRDLTAPLWRLAENNQATAGYGRPPLVRLIWGKSWNIPGIVVAVAERLEFFTPSGVPQRSWLRLRMVRMAAPVPRPAAATGITTSLSLPSLPLPAAAGGAPRVHERLGGTASVSLELSFATSLVTAADIIGLALRETPAVAFLISTGQRIAAGVGDALGKVADWVSGSGDSAVLRTLRAGLESMGRAAQNVITAVSSRLADVQKRVVATISKAATRVAAGARAVAAQLAKLTAPARKAIGTALQTVLDNVRPLARALPQAAAVIAAAVRARAARVMAIALPVLEAGRDTAERALRRAGTALSAAGTRAAEAIRAAMASIAQTMQEMRHSGRTSILPAVQTALADVAQSVATLWAAGARRAAQAIEKTVSAMTTGLKNLLEAGEALTAVAGNQLRASIDEAAAALRTALGKWVAGDDAAAAQVSDAGVDLAAAVDVQEAALDEPAYQSLLAPVTGVAAVLDPAPSKPAAEIAARVEPLLANLDTALGQLQAADEQATRTLVTATLATVPAPPEPTTEGSDLPPQPAAATRAVEFGERLDHISYHYFGDAAFWRLLATFNNLDDPLHLAEGLVLRIPPLARGGAG